MVGQTTSKGYNGSLGRCVVKEVRSPNVVVDGAAIYDSRPSSHMGQRILGEVKERMDVGVECIFPLGPVGIVSNFWASAKYPCTDLQDAKGGAKTHSSRSLISSIMF